MHAGKLIGRALKQAGVECVFTLSGAHIMPIYDGCLDEGIRIIDVRHEQVYLISGNTAALWAKGFWFSENDILHIGLIIWMLYIAFVLAPHLKDSTSHA